MTQIGTPENPVRVAIVGAGPSGFYAAEHILKDGDLHAQVDLFDRLPRPFGVVPGGVAPHPPKIPDEHPERDWDDAYATQSEIRPRKLARGHRIIGLKAGLTSHAKMKQMGVTTPVFGFMADNYENRLRDSMKRMTSLLEPTAIGAISLIVGFVALSLVLALSSVYEGVV
mgnify:CR=1 FL=1